MTYTVSEDTEIVLNGKKYLLEAGDQIVLENISSAAQKELAVRFGEVESYESYLDTKEAIRKFLASAIANSDRTNKKVERVVADVKDFLDNYLEDFVMSLANPKIHETINQEKIEHSAMSPNQQNIADIDSAVSGRKQEHKQEMINAFGKSPEQAVKDMKAKKDEERIFESINYLYSL